MTISVIDSGSSMRRIITATPDERADLVREMWSPLAGMYHFVPGGVDMATVHCQNFGFDWKSTTEPIQEGLERLVEADAWNRITEALKSGSAALRLAKPNIEVPDLQVLLVLGDPANKHFLNEIQGLSAFGGIAATSPSLSGPRPRFSNGSKRLPFMNYTTMCGIRPPESYGIR